MKIKIFCIYRHAPTYAAVRFLKAQCKQNIAQVLTDYMEDYEYV